MTMSDFYWLIGAPGQNYLASRQTKGFGEFYWTRDHTQALRFFSEAQADDTAVAIRRMAPELWGFALTLGEAKPVEHGWIAARDATIAELREEVSALKRDLFKAAQTRIDAAATIKQLRKALVEARDLYTSPEYSDKDVNFLLARIDAALGVKE